MFVHLLLLLIEAVLVQWRKNNCVSMWIEDSRQTKTAFELYRKIFQFFYVTSTNNPKMDSTDVPEELDCKIGRNTGIKMLWPKNRIIGKKNGFCDCQPLIYHSEFCGK